MSTYSFLSIQATIAGPGILASLGNGAAAAEEGITFSMEGDKNSLTIGAGGEAMNSLHASKAGTATVRLLKTSPTNAVLMAAYNAQTSNPALHGNNVFTVRDTFRGDVCVATGVAFKKAPDLTWAKDGGMNEWVFDCGSINELLGTGAPALT